MISFFKNQPRKAALITVFSFFSLLILVYLVRFTPKITQPRQLAEGGGLGLSVNKDNQPNESVSYNCEAGKNALELLRKKVADDLEVKTYSFGSMVESINGFKGGTDNKYWLYFVDGKAATVSADTYRCQGSEPVEWRLTVSSEM